MSNKITIIGAGQVGSTIAFALTLKQLASEIVLIDIAKDRAMGEAMDIRQGTPFIGPVYIHDGDYEDAKDSDIVVLTSGVARKPGQSRLDLAQTNVNITKSIIPQITKVAPNALYVIVANPVDILTYQFVKTSGIPENHIFGTGTMLDTARFRARIAETYKVGQENVHGYVFGEHGDSSFIPWSCASISAVPIDEYPEAMKRLGREVEPVDKDAMIEYVRKSGGKIIANKGATFYAVSASVVQLCNVLLAASDSMATVSTLMHGEYGIDDVCLSTLCLVGPNGYQGKVHVELTDEEVEKLQKSADALKAVISQIEI